MIECTIKNRVGLITLNRPEKLNALNASMIKAIQEALDAWKTDPLIQCVVIRSAVEHAFSAGGDLKEVYTLHNSLPVSEAHHQLDSFFEMEYKLNEAIYRYPKPYVALLHGIGMGGGLGISLHGRYRIVSEKVSLAMPEGAIGFFPDVVSAAFLTQCPGFIGTFLAITGYVMNTADALYTGLGTHFVPYGTMEVFLEALIQGSSEGSMDEILHGLLDYFAGGEIPVASEIAHYRALIDESFSKPSLEEALACFSLGRGPWVRKILEDIEAFSPLSLKVTYELMKRARNASFQEIKKLNEILAFHFLRQKDVLEGIRAKMIDKDHQPRWQYRDVEDISEDIVQSFFESLPKKP